MAHMSKSLQKEFKDAIHKATMDFVSEHEYELPPHEIGLLVMNYGLNLVSTLSDLNPVYTKEDVLTCLDAVERGIDKVKTPLMEEPYR